MTRLHALLDLGLAEPPAAQVAKILDDAKPALDFDYAEVGYGGSEYTKVFAAGNEVTPERPGIGWRGAHLTKPRMIFDTKQDEVADDHSIAAARVRSLLFWPLASEGDPRVLTLGWNKPRSEFISEDEIQYLNFLAALISRLLDAADDQKKINERVHTDALTGLHNRAAILDHLEQQISAAQRSNSQVAVLYLDLNQFKMVNDTYGHSVGDGALAEIGRRMQSVLRKHETVGRIGGDEFAVVVSAFKDAVELEGIAARLLRALSAPILYQGVHLNTSASVGIALYPRDGQNVRDLLAQADLAMYTAKRSGPATFAFHSSGGESAAPKLRLDPEHFENQFLLCYQPIIFARTERMLGAEVLVRWLQPAGGLALPKMLLQAAIQQDCLPQFERLMLTTAVRKATALSKEAGPLSLHVNVADPDDALLEAAPNTTASIALEFNEEQIASNPDRYIEFFTAARAAGYRVGISQFGSGFLSLRSFARMQIDFVKVGPEYFREAMRSARALRTLVDQAHSASSSVIAEGVETELEREILTSNGVDALQGYSICSPLTEQDFLSWTRYRASA